MARGRLQTEFLERVEVFSDRCVAVAEQLAVGGRFVRITEQLAASGSSVGANLAEADEAMSTKDFRKHLAIATKELAETRFWPRLCFRRNWRSESRLMALIGELTELKAIVGAILKNTRTPESSQSLPPRKPNRTTPQLSESQPTSDLAILQLVI